MCDCMAGTAVVVELLLVLSASVLIMKGGGRGGKDKLLNAMVRSQVLWQ